MLLWWWCVAGIAVVCRRSSCEGSVAVVWVLVVLGVTPFLQKAVKSRKERWARLCLGRTLAGRGGPSREGGTVRWAAYQSLGRSQSGGGRRQPPCAPSPELGMKRRGADGR